MARRCASDSASCSSPSCVEAANKIGRPLAAASNAFKTALSAFVLRGDETGNFKVPVTESEVRPRD